MVGKRPTRSPRARRAAMFRRQRAEIRRDSDSAKPASTPSRIGAQSLVESNPSPGVTTLTPAQLLESHVRNESSSDPFNYTNTFLASEFGLRGPHVCRISTSCVRSRGANEGLTTMPGLSETAAAVILAEIGETATSTPSFLRLNSRRGPKKAILAVAASMLIDVYYMLRDGIRGC